MRLEFIMTLINSLVAVDQLYLVDTFKVEGSYSPCRLVKNPMLQEVFTNVM